jgi:hypothetical protein
MRKCHLDCASARHHSWIHENIADAVDGILNISIHFIDDILAWTTQNHSDGRCFIRSDIGEVFVANFADFEQICLSANIRFVQVHSVIDDTGTSNTKLLK